MDAYSSDAIPVHLLTREALALYRAKLAPGGIIVFHISNRHLKLAQVLGALVADAGMAGLLQDHRPDLPEETNENADRDPRRHLLPSSWAVVAAGEQDLAGFADDDRWQPLEAAPGADLWTDGFSNIFGVLR